MISGCSGIPQAKMIEKNIENFKMISQNNAEWKKEKWWNAQYDKLEELSRKNQMRVLLKRIKILSGQTKHIPLSIKKEDNSETNTPDE